MAEKESAWHAARTAPRFVLASATGAGLFLLLVLGLVLALALLLVFALFDFLALLILVGWSADRTPAAAASSARGLSIAGLQGQAGARQQTGDANSGQRLFQVFFVHETLLGKMLPFDKWP